ncbi:hypothetical protein [Trichothermofontia sp.]
MEILAFGHVVGTHPWQSLAMPERPPSLSTASQPQPTQAIPTNYPPPEPATPMLESSAMLTNPVMVVVLPLF